MRESGENNLYYGFIDDISPPCPALFSPCSKIPTSSLGIPGPRSRSRRRGLGTGTICWVYLSGLWSGIETWIHQSQQFSSNNINHYNKNKTRNISSYAAILTVDAYEFPNHQRKTFALLGCAGWGGSGFSSHSLDWRRMQSLPRSLMKTICIARMRRMRPQRLRRRWPRVAADTESSYH